MSSAIDCVLGASTEQWACQDECPGLSRHRRGELAIEWRRGQGSLSRLYSGTVRAHREFFGKEIELLSKLGPRCAWPEVRSWLRSAVVMAVRLRRWWERGVALRTYLRTGRMPFCSTSLRGIALFCASPHLKPVERPWGLAYRLWGTLPRGRGSWLPAPVPAALEITAAAADDYGGRAMTSSGPTSRCAARATAVPGRRERRGSGAALRARGRRPCRC